MTVLNNWLNEKTLSSVAEYSLIGIFTKPNEILPFHILLAAAIPTPA
jgi:hypothetical protein